MEIALSLFIGFLLGFVAGAVVMRRTAVASIAVLGRGCVTNQCIKRAQQIIESIP